MTQLTRDIQYRWLRICSAAVGMTSMGAIASAFVFVFESPLGHSGSRGFLVIRGTEHKCQTPPWR